MESKDMIEIEECRVRIVEAIATLRKKIQSSVSDEDKDTIISLELTHYVVLIALVAKLGMKIRGDSCKAQTKRNIMRMLYEEIDQEGCLY